jgi:hypothetical protein
MWPLDSLYGMTQEHQHGNGEKLGEVHFATSCNKPAQSDFDRAVALTRLRSGLPRLALESPGLALGIIAVEPSLPSAFLYQR